MEIKQGHHGFFVGESEDKPLAELTFTLDGDSIIATHTYVSPSLRGQGIGRELVRAFADYAKAQGKRIVPQCSYVHKVLQESGE